MFLMIGPAPVMTRTPVLIPFAAFAAALSAGCAGSSDQYPSLAIRDAERVSGTLSPVAPPPSPTTPASTITRIEDAVAAAVSSYQRFQSIEPEALALAKAARGASDDDAARAEALVAIANLTSIRGETILALADLDRLELEAASTFEVYPRSSHSFLFSKHF